MEVLLAHELLVQNALLIEGVELDGLYLAVIVVKVGFVHSHVELNLDLEV